MATLSAAELLDIRRIVGDVDESGSSRFIGDVVMQTLHDAAAADLPTTYVFYLQRLVGMTALKIATSDNFGRREQHEQLHEHYKELLTYWEDKAGLSGVKIQVGSLDLDIDTDLDDLPENN